MLKLSNQALLDAYHNISKGERAWTDSFVAAICNEIVSRGIIAPCAVDASKVMDRIEHQHPTSSHDVGRELILR